jgi:hypothetical protein
MEEVQINTAAHSAEASTPGVQTQFISKSGGNQFRGTFFGGYSPESWQAFNIDDDQIARGLQGGGGLDPEDVNRLNSYQDMNVGLGGYVIKDQALVVRLVPPPEHPGQLRQLPGQAADDDPQQLQRQGHLQPVDQQQVDRLHAAVAEETAAALRLVAARRRHRHQQHRVDDVEPELLGVGAQGRVERRHQRQLVRRVRAGQYGYDWTNGVNGTGPRYEDIGNNIINGRNRNWARERRRNQVLGTISYFLNKAGDHNFRSAASSSTRPSRTSS